MKQTIFAIIAGLVLSACGGRSSSDSGTTPPSTGVGVPQCEIAANLSKTNTMDLTDKTIKK